MEKEINKTGLQKLIDLIRSALALKYEKPDIGIPKGDLHLYVQNSLDKADTALQEAYTVVDIGIQQSGTGDDSNYTYTISASGLFSSLETIWAAHKIPVLKFALAHHTASYSIPLYKNGFSDFYYGVCVGSNGYYLIKVFVDSTTQRIYCNGFYNKPTTGVPKTDMASAVQTSLGLADTSVQIGTVVGTVDDE